MYKKDALQKKKICSYLECNINVEWKPRITRIIQKEGKLQQTKRNAMYERYENYNVGTFFYRTPPHT